MQEVESAEVLEDWVLQTLSPRALRGFPVGALLTLRTGDEANFRPRLRSAAGNANHYSTLEYVTRRPIGRAAALEGVTAPLFWWRQSPAVSGLVVYSGRLFPAWRGALLVGALQHDKIIRLSGGTGGLREAERLLEGEFRRIRDVREAPDGSIWFIAETEGAVYQMAPAGQR